ncbi:DUF3710 domain-containing protein [Corynebacterium sp. H128]|uniref:DUF3710 domain-containing protein n=1 Tax=Corynebacterium sp. H128 TaxID=3133427 RepID=UPI0030A24A85
MWPFSKKDAAAEDPEVQSEPSAADVDKPATAQEPVPEYGPFDGDSVDIQSYDFSDFSHGTLDLGSIKIPMPDPSEVQVEMGPEGPRMMHIVTRPGRITPVAFASTASGGLWEESIPEIVAGMSRDGLQTSLEDGPWGQEIVGLSEHATIRMIGVEGPRWTLRITLAAPNESAADLAELGREVIARTFVYRGEQPMLAGTVLPVVMPAALVAQVQQAMQERAAAEAAQATAGQQPSETAPAEPETEPIAPPRHDEHLKDAHLDSGSALEQMRAEAARKPEAE